VFFGVFDLFSFWPSFQRQLFSLTLFFFPADTFFSFYLEGWNRVDVFLFAVVFSFFSVVFFSELLPVSSFGVFFVGWFVLIFSRFDIARNRVVCASVLAVIVPARLTAFTSFFVLRLLFSLLCSVFLHLRAEGEHFSFPRLYMTFPFHIVFNREAPDISPSLVEAFFPRSAVDKQNRFSLAWSKPFCHWVDAK